MEASLPAAPASILDVGGGPGRYAIELSARGYSVTLTDLSEGCLQLSKAKAAERPVELTDVVQADARDLSQFASDSFDAVLLLGPLYHLLTASDREQAVSESLRVLRPGGRILAAFISRFGPFRHAAAFDPAWALCQTEYALSILATGVHDRGSGFPNAYFAHPSEVAPSMERHGVTTDALIGCEGAVSMNEDLVNELTGEDWDTWVDLNYRIASDPAALGCAEHLLYIGTKAD